MSRLLLLHFLIAALTVTSFLRLLAECTAKLIML